MADLRSNETAPALLRKRRKTEITKNDSCEHSIITPNGKSNITNTLTAAVAWKTEWGWTLKNNNNKYTHVYNSKRQFEQINRDFSCFCYCYFRYVTPLSLLTLRCTSLPLLLLDGSCKLLSCCHWGNQRCEKLSAAANIIAAVVVVFFVVATEAARTPSARIVRRRRQSGTQFGWQCISGDSRNLQKLMSLVSRHASC